MRILVLEDHPLVAFQLEADLTRLGHQVIGPFASLAALARNRRRFDAAILDFRIGSERSLNFAARLEADFIPFVFYSGSPESLISTGQPLAPLVLKPARTEELLDLLGAERERLFSELLTVRLLPELRRLARDLLRDSNAADQLVIRVLLQAGQAAQHRRISDPARWLRSLIRKACSDQLQQGGAAITSRPPHDN